jgi:uncharacterized membrane protein
MFAEKNSMHTFLTIVLVLHIVSGFLALGFGLLALLSKKGQRRHRLSGRVFFYLMLSVAFSAVIISGIKLNLFLLLIAGFAFYQNVQGYRSVKNKSLRPSLIDWSATLVGLVSAIIMLWTLNIVLMVFGGISLFLVFSDLRTYNSVLNGKPISRLAWLSRHIGMMMGAYIATVTAFVVVNVQHVEPSWLPWLAPTVIGVPLMRYWDWKFTRSGKAKATPVD